MFFLYSQEQIFDFYETLRNSSSESVDQFQAILEVFIADILKYRKEIKRLEDSYKRYGIRINFSPRIFARIFRDKETNEKFLRNLEEDQERDMRQLEQTIRQEVNIFQFVGIEHFFLFAGTSEI